MARLVAALLRHGDYRQLADTPSAWQPFPLTEQGRAQSRAAAETLLADAAAMHCRIDPDVHSSQLLRAWETARIIADHLGKGADVTSFDALAERGMGSAANLSIARIEAIVREDPRFGPLPPDWKSNSEFCLPLQGAESLLMAGKRVATHLETTMQALARTAHDDVIKVFVGHGAAIRHAALQLGILAREDVARLSMHHAVPVYIEITDQGWQHVAGKWKLRDDMAAMD